MKKTFKNDALVKLATLLNKPADQPKKAKVKAAPKESVPLIPLSKKAAAQTCKVGKRQWRSTTREANDAREKARFVTRIEVLLPEGWAPRFSFYHDQPIDLVAELQTQFKYYREHEVE